MIDTEPELSRPHRRGGLWHHLEFRRLWVGETVSQFGTTVSQLALPLVAILVVHASTFEVGLLAVFFVLLARDLHVSAGVIGLITSTSAVGGLIGSLVASRFATRVGPGRAIWISAAAGGPCAFVAPFVRHDWTLALLALALTVTSMTTVIYNITQVSFRQGLCPPELLGRMNASMRFLVWGTMPLGGVIGGALGSVIGVRETLFVAAAGGSLAFLPVFLSPLRRMRELPSYQDIA